MSTKSSLSILRTCKMFYEDCKDLLWKQNTLYLDSHFALGPAEIIYVQVVKLVTATTHSNSGLASLIATGTKQA